MLHRSWILIGSFLLSAPLAEASTCILPKPYVNVPRFAEYLYQTAQSIALARVVSVHESDTVELGRAEVEIIEVLKGEPWSAFGFHTRRMPTGPKPNEGDIRVIALNGGVAAGCLNSFVASFDLPSLIRELRRIRNGR